MPDRLLRRLNGPRGSALAAYGVVAAIHAGVYARPGDRLIISSGLDVLDQAVPLAIPATLWGIVAVLAFVGAVTTPTGAQRDHADAWGFGGFVGMLTLWGVTYLTGWALGEPVSRLVFALIYLSVAVAAAAASRMTNPTRPAEGF